MEGLDWFRRTNAAVEVQGASDSTAALVIAPQAEGLSWWRSSSLITRSCDDVVNSPRTTETMSAPAILATPPPFALIINADDLGYSPSRDAAIIALYLSGALTRASLLVNGCSARAALWSAFAIGLPVGIHINLTEGAPILPKHKVRSLLKPNTGLFRGKVGLREALIRGGVIEERELALEIAAQFAAFKQLHPRGLAPTHADGHQHVHVLPGVVKEFTAAAVANRVWCVRLPMMEAVEADFDEDELSDVGSRSLFNAKVSEDALIAKVHFHKNKLISPDVFIGFSTMGADMSFNRIMTVLNAVAVTRSTTVRSVEWMVHPGITTQAPTAAKSAAAGCGGGTGPDAFSLSMDRTHEAAVLASEGLRVWLWAHARRSQ